MTRERWMAVFFATGSTCFFIGPFPGYASLVGDTADAITFFIGSILFTAGGALQTSWRLQADMRLHGARRRGGRRRFSPPALCFSMSRPTKQCTQLCRVQSTTSSCGDQTPWGRSASWSQALSPIAPALGAVGCLRARCRGWWEPSINLLGCIFFGISAIAGYVVPSSGSVLDLAAANWNTSLGAACFLASAVATLHSGHALKSPRLQRPAELERDVASQVEHLRRWQA